MDSFIYALVLVPALRELLPRSGIPPNTGEVGYFSGILFALFLVGRGLSLLWGPVGDRFGRVRTLMPTILCYSVFTFASALVTNVWQLAAFRLLGGIGIGGEWTLGGPSSPKNGRRIAVRWARVGCIPAPTSAF